MALERDPYEILGVPRDATDAQIAKARRRLSRENHPDVNSDPAAASRFVEIQQAFELLSDPVVRAEYDRTGRLPGRRAGARGREAAPPPSPPVFGTVAQVPPPVPAPRPPATARRRGSVGPAVLGLITLSFSLVCVLLVSQCGGASGGPSSPAKPTVKPLDVPEAQASALAVHPVFHSVASDSDLIGELVGAPVQYGFELLLPLYSSSGRPSHYCVDVTVPETDPGPDKGETFVESPVGTVTVGGANELAYPAVLPGTYKLDTDCNSETVITLGTLTVPGLGVISSFYPTDAMVVFGAHTSGNVTTVTYGAVGENRDGIRKPPADYTCIDGGGTPGAAAYWQPVRDLVSQQVNGERERFSTGTLIFRDSTGQSPRGTFYSSCAMDTSLFQLGITVP
jgi:hypothetical protein